MTDQEVPQDLAYDRYGRRYENAREAKSVPQGDQQNDRENGIVPLAFEEARPDPYPQRNQGDERIQDCRPG